MIIEIRLLLTPDETVMSIIFLTLGKNVTFDTMFLLKAANMLKELPSFNKENFSKFKVDDNMKSVRIHKKQGIYKNLIFLISLFYELILT